MRAEGSSVIGDGEQAVILLMPDVDGVYIFTFESLKLEGSYVGYLLYSLEKYAFTVVHSDLKQAALLAWSSM